MSQVSTDFAAILGGMPQPYLVLDANLSIVGASDSYLTLTSRTRSDIVGRHILEAFPPNPDEPGSVEQDALAVSLNHVLKTGEAHEMAVIQYDIPAMEGGFSQRFWTPIHTPVIGNDGEVAFIIQNPMDVTERVLKNREADARLRVALHAADLASWEYEPDTDIWRRSPAVDELFGFNPGEGGPVATPFFARMHPDDYTRVGDHMRSKAQCPDQTVMNFDYRIVLPDGAVRHVSSRGEILRTSSGKVRMIGVLMDVTADRVREEALAQALRQQELLLAEVNHRVKNSLQLVVSTLRLQARRLTFPITPSAFEEAIARVRAIISVHERLYRSEDLLTVDMSTHLPKLAEDIMAHNEPRLSVHVDSIGLAPERAIPVSVIVNELLTSFLPRAKPDTMFAISLSEAAGGLLTLTIEVSGSLKPGRMAELATKLIASMVNQLGGSFEECEKPGVYLSVLSFAKAVA